MKYGWLIGVILGAVAARLWLLFSTPWAPGINGGYYFVQARALLERGELAFPDLPLVFYLEAAGVRLWQTLSGHGLCESVLVAVKICDGLLPALAAAPIFLLLERWRLVAVGPRWISAVGTAVVVLGFPTLSVVGDLQKHSLALALLAAALWRLDAWLDSPSTGRLVGVGLCLALIALTHIGVFGAALFWVAAIIFTALCVRKRFSWPTGHIWVVAAILALLGMMVVLVGWRFDPQRIFRLWAAVSHPVNFAQNESSRLASSGPSLPLKSCLPWFLVTLMALSLMRIIWRGHRPLPIGIGCIITGSAISAVALTAPVFSQDMAIRLALIAVLPGVLVVYFAIQYVNTRGLRTVLAVGVALVFLLPSVPFLIHGGEAMLSPDAMRELQSLAAVVRSPANTLIVAPHGLEWWTAWTLRTKIAQPGAVNPSAWRNYTDVFFIEQKGWFFRRQPPPSRVRTARAMLPGAEIVHDGEYFRLIRASPQPEGER